MKVQIRSVTPADILTLRDIGTRTFWETFASSNSEKDMDTYIGNSFSIEKLKSEVNNPESWFYFAMLGIKAIGYLKVNFGSSQTELVNATAMEIERIYVLREFYGQHVGQMLLEKATNLARQKMSNFIWLGVWEQNFRAIRFYEKNGFAKFGTHVFKLGNDEQTDILMRRFLSDGSASPSGGPSSLLS